MKVLYAKEVSCPNCRATLSAMPVGALVGIPAGGLIYMGVDLHLKLTQDLHLKLTHPGRQIMA
jgi:hypothetical protein